MPILTASGGVADLVCAVCGVEQHVITTEWFVPDGGDTSIIGAPPCPGCGSQEFFTWTDWVYVGDDGQPDPDHDGARQMVLIQRVATALSRSQATRNEAGRTYPTAPTAPTQAAVRAYAARLRGEA